jgi:U3 small nucleolar RNA-associated protein 25
MSTETEVKLLTLLNVAAIKKPRDLDIPGGQRGSPSLRNSSSSSSPAVTPAPAPVGGVKKRKSVLFGGELGPSGSGYGKKVKVVVEVNGKGKGKGKEVNGNGYANGHALEQEIAGVEIEEGSDDENVVASGEYKSELGGRD